MNRRGFLKALVGGIAGAAAVRTWPFRVFSFPGEVIVVKRSFCTDDVVREALRILLRNMNMAASFNTEFAMPNVGSTVTIRYPQRFVRSM